MSFDYKKVKLPKGYTKMLNNLLILEILMKKMLSIKLSFYKINYIPIQTEVSQMRREITKKTQAITSQFIHRKENKTASMSNIIVKT